jgi:hypothetical protein
MPSPSESSSEQIFWAWFLENEEMLLHQQHTDDSRERVLNQVQNALHKIDENLAFEFGPPESRREFIVSAGGMKSCFPAVLRLKQAQPSLDRWAITYFMPRRDPSSTFELGGLKINSRDMVFSLLSRDSDIGLEVFIPEYSDADPSYKQIGYLFLDQALGEFDVVTKVFYLRFFASAEPLKFDRIPFSELPERFDELYNRLNGLSGKPN